MNREYHVAVNGNNSNDGSSERPFKTISCAASVARAGDTITVHKGTYREWVDPKFGGAGEEERITYQAVPGETVVICGSEIISNWEKTKDGIWKVEIPNSFFGSFNPYTEKIRGDWFKGKGRIHHRGEVYLNGRSLFEVESLDKVKNPVEFENAKDKPWSKYTWYCENDEKTTILWANFHEVNPLENLIEINVRPYCFWPSKTGINYITVRGFILKQAATQWAPPTALQAGLIGPHWSKGWIIENNIISDSKCSGISLGKEESTGQNEWTEIGIKHGSQLQREVVFRALAIGWSKETVGSHIIRNNTIYNCEQTGICGHLGGVFSQIYGNHIYNIHTKRTFGGAEIAGIKLHAAIDVLIENNHIHHCLRGFWMDWQAQGTRITRNLLYENDIADLYAEVNHGPYVVDNNVFLSQHNVRDVSEGGAYIHNLFGGDIHKHSVPERFTPYHFPHSTTVAGVMTILSGDNRFYNNIFASKPEEDTFTGTSAYDDCPAPDENWLEGMQNVRDYAQVKLPVYCQANLYFNGAEPFRKEKNPAVYPTIDPCVKLTVEDKDVFLSFDFKDTLEGMKTTKVDTTLLDKAFQPEARYENADGSPLCIDTDYFGKVRGSLSPTVGPFEGITKGEHKIKVAALE